MKMKVEKPKTKADLKQMFEDFRFINDFWKKYYDFKYITLKGIMYELRMWKKKHDNVLHMSRIKRRFLTFINKLCVVMPLI